MYIYIYIYYTLQLNLMYLLPSIQDWHDGKLCLARPRTFRFVVHPGSVTFAKVHSVLGDGHLMKSYLILI